jgi:ferredoxin-NADP reductase
MQTLLLLSPDLIRTNPGLAIGLVVLLAVAIQTALALVGSVRRLSHQRRQWLQERERLDYLVKAAKSQWHTAELEKASWNGWRKFKVHQKIYECEDVYSYYLKPHDGKPIPGFQPGQYLTFGLDIPGRDRQVVRCYSLSECELKSDYYRVTIKKERAPRDKPEIPPGVASTFFTEAVKEGEILNVKAPTGHFFMDTSKETPVILMGAGVGITPVLAMANQIVDSGSKREAWFFFVCRNGSDYMLRNDVERLRKFENVRVFVCFSKPASGEVKGKDYDREGRLTTDVLKELLPSSNYDYYMCGSGPFMKDMYDGLISWGVPDGRVHFEAFGPASVKRVTEAKAAPAGAAAAPVTTGKVTFAKSNCSAAWDGSAGNLYELAKASGVRIDYGCGAGSCGSCLVAVKSGEITYKEPPGFAVEAGSCLTCVGCPKGDVVLDA